MGERKMGGTLCSTCREVLSEDIELLVRHVAQHVVEENLNDTERLYSPWEGWLNTFA